MDVHTERPRRSVPQFGGWDQKGGGGGEGECTNYTVVFTQARADKKQHKTELPTPPNYNHTTPPPPLHNTTNSVFSMPPPHHKQQQLHPHNHHHHHHNTTVAISDPSVKRKRGVLSCFSCFNG